MPAWCIQVDSGHSIAAKSRAITIGMKMSLPRYSARVMASRMTAPMPQRVAVVPLSLITLFTPHDRDVCSWQGLDQPGQNRSRFAAQRTRHCFADLRLFRVDLDH